MKKKIKRIHDSLYLKENRYKKTKESFKLLINILKKKINSKKRYSVIDVGCSNGELIYQLEKHFKNFEITGLDIRSDLINKAKQNVSDKIKFIKKDIFKRQEFKKYDIVICSGVISIADNPKEFCNNLLKLKKRDGLIYLFHHFNSFDYNVYVKYQDLKNPNYLQSGWNIFSLSYLSKLFKRKKIKYYRFNSKKNILQNKKDFVRSWSIKINKKNFFTNGLMLILDQYWIEIKN